ncbi:MarR family transcriptional regulator [Brevundimonas sp. PAMC22021]|nr:MarR family transcriptional regulator [Brevundimonas sp. PAMC22021]
MDDFLPYRLSVAANLVSEAVAGVYRDLFDLRIPEWRLIAASAETGPATPQALGQRTRMDKVTVSRAAAALTARGLFRRAPNPDDRRSHLLVLTSEGSTLYAAIAPKAREIEARLFGDFTDEERSLLHALLIRTEEAALTISC